MNGDLAKVCAAIYPQVGEKITGLLAVVADEERVPTPDLIALCRASETPNALPPTLLHMDDCLEITLRGNPDVVLQVCLVRKG